MKTVQTLPNQDKAERTPRSRFGPLILALQIGALLAAVYATTVAIANIIPDDGDYAKASVLKHNLLAADDPKKIVLVGGSNLSFGTDSTVIETATSCPVVNMGMNGYFGVRFMLEEVKPYLKAGDIVVISWEYDSFYKSVDGSSTDLLMVTKANPKTFGSLNLRQKVGVLRRYPFVAQQKTLRVMGDVYESAASLVSQGEDDLQDTLNILAIEGSANFSPRGDLIGHLNITWPDDLEDGDNISMLPMDQDVLPLMQSFIHEMTSRGVKVMVSWTPIAEDFYARHKTEIERLNSQMAAIPEFNMPRPARDFVFPASQHFDTVYHLNAEGRAIRSKILTDDIVTLFGDEALCDRQP